MFGLIETVIVEMSNSPCLIKRKGSIRIYINETMGGHT